MVSLESVTSTLKSEKPRKRKRQFNPEDDIPTTTHPEVLKRDKKEINNITKSFPKLTSYYRLIGRAGRGTFSKVYKARDLFYDRYKPFKRCCEIKGLKEHYVAIKVMYDISSPQRIANEITFLSKLRSSSCVIPLITAFRNKSTSYLIFPYIEYDNFEDIYTKMTLVDIKYYLVNLFTALKNIHAKGIIHRDVKPGNFLFSLKNRKGFLTDFGLAEKMSNYDDIEQRIPEDAEMIAEKYSSSQGERPGIFKNDSRKSIHVNRSGTKGFRAPEVMMRYEYQTGAMDIWAAGIILLSFLSGCYPLFDANDDADIMLELAHIYGLKKLTECGEYYGRRFRVNIPTVSELPIPFEEICRCMNKSRVDGWDKNEFMEAIDLTKSCLQLIHSERITASKALEHPFLINISILDY
ncbi:kinase-like domain-containing protein [Pilobolus umbonatus]|nr:kinase-like domain-containing protein [Pilobolus umbonatus]